ncbi:hypothetical protein ARMSODRAFT_364948 [Armillaria solidipes]|uniref:Uncharacterized protein n=1 Tax=Armillaria solidipes TaxID=1076256 RepID=A0A2H3BTN6_9AGAR|nr:hypothetical protein ARMSODRAFT_364948 [Armillaria solidipes]
MTADRRWKAQAGMIFTRKALRNEVEDISVRKFQRRPAINSSSTSRASPLTCWPTALHRWSVGLFRIPRDRVRMGAISREHYQQSSVTMEATMHSDLPSSRLRYDTILCGRVFIMLWGPACGYICCLVYMPPLLARATMAFSTDNVVTSWVRLKRCHRKTVSKFFSSTARIDAWGFL